MLDDTFINTNSIILIVLLFSYNASCLFGLNQTSFLFDYNVNSEVRCQIATLQDVPNMCPLNKIIVNSGKPNSCTFEESGNRIDLGYPLKSRVLGWPFAKTRKNGKHFGTKGRNRFVIELDVEFSTKLKSNPSSVFWVKMETLRN